MGLLLLSQPPIPPTPPAAPNNNRWIAIAQIGLDSATEYVSGGVVIHPTQTYEGRVLDWGSIESSIPTPSGLPRVGDALIRIADTDREWRNLLSVQTPRRRRVTTKFMQVGGSESAADPIYSGEVKDGNFPEGVAELQLRDTTFSWIDKPLPLLISQQNFPDFPDVDPAFLPIVLGQCQSRAIPPGAASGGPAKSPTGQSAILQAAITDAAAIIAAYTAVDLVALGPTPSKVDRWVRYVENEYGRALAMVIDEVNRQFSNGTILLTDLQDARDNVQDNIDAFLAKATATGAINSDWLQITNQSVANQRNIFGANFEFLLGPLDAKIDTITSSPTAIASYVQGVIPLPHIGYLAGTGDRWAAARHQLWNVLAIYRKLPNETIFTVVDPAEFNVVEEDLEFAEHPGVTFTCVFIDFIAEQDDGTEIRMDADGFYFRDTWNGMPAAGYDASASPPMVVSQGPLRNPIDAFIHLTRVAFIEASAEAGWDGNDIEDVYDKLENGTNFTPPYYCDAAIVDSETPREVLEKFLTSFQLDIYAKRTGLLSMSFIDAEDPNRKQITEQMMVKGSFKEYLANPTCNRLAYLFARDYSQDKWSQQAIFDNAYDQAVLGLIEKDDLELWFVRDQVTAVSVAGRRMEYLSLGSYQQEWQSPLPIVLDRMDLAQQVGITHRSGLEYLVGYEDREVKIIGRTIDLGRMTVNYRSILRSPVRIDTPAPVNPPDTFRPTLYEERDAVGLPYSLLYFVEDGAFAIDSDAIVGESLTRAHLTSYATSPFSNYAQLFLYGFVDEPDPLRTLSTVTIYVRARRTIPTPTGIPIAFIGVYNGRVDNEYYTGAVVELVGGAGLDAEIPLQDFSHEFTAAEFVSAFPGGAAEIWIRIAQHGTTNQSFEAHFYPYDCWIKYVYI